MRWRILLDSANQRASRCLHDGDEAGQAALQTARASLIGIDAARKLAGVFKSLSDPTRLRIISLLSQHEFCVTDLAAALEMEQSTISHQLRDMRAQRLVNTRREGRHIFYRLDDPHVRDLFRQGLAHTQDEA